MKIIKQGSVECCLRITCRKCGTIYEIEKRNLNQKIILLKCMMVYCHIIIDVLHAKDIIMLT